MSWWRAAVLVVLRLRGCVALALPVLVFVLALVPAPLAFLAVAFFFVGLVVVGALVLPVVVVVDGGTGVAAPPVLVAVAPLPGSAVDAGVGVLAMTVSDGQSFLFALESLSPTNVGKREPVPRRSSDKHASNQAQAIKRKQSSNSKEDRPPPTTATLPQLTDL
jgi:hypothetical protein